MSRLTQATSFELGLLCASDNGFFGVEVVHATGLA